MEHEAAERGCWMSACGHTHSRIHRVVRHMALWRLKRLLGAFSGLGWCLDCSGPGTCLHLYHVLWWRFGECSAFLELKPQLTPRSWAWLLNHDGWETFSIFPSHPLASLHIMLTTRGSLQRLIAFRWTLFQDSSSCFWAPWWVGIIKFRCSPPWSISSGVPCSWDSLSLVQWPTFSYTFLLQPHSSPRGLLLRSSRHSASSLAA